MDSVIVSLIGLCAFVGMLTVAVMVLTVVMVRIEQKVNTVVEAVPRTVNAAASPDVAWRGEPDVDAQRFIADAVHAADRRGLMQAGEGGPRGGAFAARG